MSATAHVLRRALATNSTATDFTEKEPKTTEPSGAGVFDLLSSELGVGAGGYSPSYAQVIPFGTDANDETFSMRVWGWSKTNDATPVYVPQLLATLSVTLGSTSGCDGAAIGTSHLLADTIAVSAGASEGAFSSVVSSANNTAAHVLIHLRGARFIEFDFDLVSAAAANAFWRPVD